MDRFKTYDATGVAPNGRLYAGDLNLFQDLVAALYSLTQNLGANNIAIGEAGLILSRYGAGEARISGHLRIDGIFRAISGLYAGQFTTVARDAIAAGSRPNGLVIYNSTTSRLEINSGSDAVPSWTPLTAAISRGAVGGRPGAAPSNAYSWWFATDVNGGTLTYSDGANWYPVTAGLVHGAQHQAGGADPITVSKAMLAADVPVVPVGGVMDWPWASGSIPAWALLPYGQLLTQAAYPAMQTLADASGRPYGGVAGTNFNMPDYRGRVGAGKDDMGGTAANRITAAVSGINGATLGAVGGVEGVTLTTAQLPAHNHPVSGAPSISPNPHNHGLTVFSNNVGSISGADGMLTDVGQNGTGGGGRYNTQNDTTRITSVTLTMGVGTLATSNTGSGSAHQNVQPTIIVNNIMRVL